MHAPHRTGAAVHPIKSVRAHTRRPITGARPFSPSSAHCMRTRARSCVSVTATFPCSSTRSPSSAASYSGERASARAFKQIRLGQNSRSFWRRRRRSGRNGGRSTTLFSTQSRGSRCAESSLARTRTRREKKCSRSPIGALLRWSREQHGLVLKQGCQH